MNNSNVGQTDPISVKILSQSALEKTTEESIKWIYSLHKKKKLAYDRKRIQRLLIPWDKIKRNSYLTTLLNGTPKKDTFLLASVKNIVSAIQSELDKSNKPKLKKYLEFNLKYFTQLQNSGKEYLVLDGQHRIEEIVKYIDSETDFSPTEDVEYQVDGESGTIDIMGNFDSMPNIVKDFILNNIELSFVIYSTGDLQKLVNIFITSNSMKSMSNHEKRILNFNINNEFIVDLAFHDLNIQHMFKSIKHGMTGDYDLDAKGDTLFMCEMLLFIHDNYYENQESKLKDAFGPVNIYNEESYDTFISQTERDTTHDIFRLMSDLCKLYPNLSKKNFSKSSFYNLFYTLSYFMQDTNHWGKEEDIAGKYKIVDKENFSKWFFDKENERLHAPDTSFTFKHPVSGKVIKQKHDLSFSKHNADQKHKSKISIKGQGGSKYDFNDYARLRYLLADLIEDIDMLVKQDILSSVGSRSGLSREEAAVAHNVPLSETDTLHLDEILPVSTGGDRTVENTQFLDAETNINMSDRIK